MKERTKEEKIFEKEWLEFVKRKVEVWWIQPAARIAGLTSDKASMEDFLRVLARIDDNMPGTAALGYLQYEYQDTIEDRYDEVIDFCWELFYGRSYETTSK